jgi:hypothetical protein
MYGKIDRTGFAVLAVLLVASLGAANLAPRQPATQDAVPRGLVRTPLSSRSDRAWTLNQILVALRFVETGGTQDEGRHAVGDGGAAIGPFQIHRAYWKDAGVPGAFDDCRDLDYARAVVVSYWRRYCPRALQALDAEVLARIHNGGPTGCQKTATLKFWRRVERELANQRAE